MTTLIEVPDFSELEKGVYVAKREPNRSEWEGNIPAPVAAAVAKLVSDGGTLIVPLTSDADYDRYRSVFAAAARVINLSANVVRVYADKEKTKLTGARISVGEKRGRKATEAKPAPAGPAAS